MKFIKGWLAAGLLLIGAAGAAAAEPEQGAFDVILLALKHDWQAMRYHKQTGESWYAFKGDWKVVPEGTEVKPPSGDYKVQMCATGEHDWIALRVERKSGRSWRLAALRWIEMQVVEGEEPQPLPQPLAENEAE